MKKKVKKKRLKIKNIFLLIFFVTLISFSLYYLSLIPIKGYYIKGNSYYTDYEILTMAGLNKYPSYLLTNSFNVTDKVKKNKLIKNIKLKKKLDFTMEVIVNENKILFYDDINKVSVLENSDKVDYFNEKYPVLINKIEDKKVYEKFIKKMPLINEDTFSIISEIKYDPNDIDKERFLVSINDGNYVYLTLSKFSSINDYLKISKTLQGKKGILYLDYGNYFLSK